MPDRILRYTQEIVNRYLVKALDDGHAPATPYDLFATEGGTAAMCYLFDSLKCNFLVNPGDRIALMTPIFTPYLNIPILNDYDLDVTYIQANTIDADGLHTWQYPDGELEKLRDPSIKLVAFGEPVRPAVGGLGRCLAGQARQPREERAARPHHHQRRRLRHLRPPLSVASGRSALQHRLRVLVLEVLRSHRLASRRHRHGCRQRLRRPHREAARGQEEGAREPLRGASPTI